MISSLALLITLYVARAADPPAEGAPPGEAPGSAAPAAAPDGAASGAGTPAAGAPSARPAREGGTETPQEGGGRRARHQQAAPAASSNDVWYLAAAAGGVALMAVGLFWFRRPRRAPRLPDGVQRVEPAGLFGAGSPAVVDGLSQWIVAEADEADFAPHLVARLAASRAVLVQAPARLALPPQSGGPVFSSSFDKPETLADAAYDLFDLHPSLVVVVLPGATGITEWSRGVVDDIPVVAVVRAAAPGEGPVVTCTRQGADWTFRPA